MLPEVKEQMPILLCILLSQWLLMIVYKKRKKKIKVQNKTDVKTSTTSQVRLNCLHYELESIKVHHLEKQFLLLWEMRVNIRGISIFAFYIMITLFVCCFSFLLSLFEIKSKKLKTECVGDLTLCVYNWKGKLPLQVFEDFLCHPWPQ